MKFSSALVLRIKNDHSLSRHASKLSKIENRKSDFKFFCFLLKNSLVIVAEIKLLTVILSLGREVVYSGNSLSVLRFYLPTFFSL